MPSEVVWLPRKVLVIGTWKILVIGTWKLVMIGTSGMSAESCVVEGT
jgi:hypothetical protein